MNTSPLSIGKSSNFIWALVEGISGRSMVAFNEIGHLAVFFSFPLSRWWYPKIQWFQNLIFPTFSLFQTPPLKDFPSEKWSKLFPGRSAEVSCWYIHNFAALALRGVPRSGVPWGDTNSILPGCQNGQPKWLYGVIWYYMMFYVGYNLLVPFITWDAPRSRCIHWGVYEDHGAISAYNQQKWDRDGIVFKRYFPRH